MPLVLAIKNKTEVVVGSDVPGPSTGSDRFGQLMPVTSHAVLLMAGNLEAVRHAILEIAMPKVNPDSSAAGVAQFVQAAMVLDVVPKLAEVKGRVEIIVAGIDPIHHQDEPGLYYMDSAQDFYLKVVAGDAVTAGSTAAVGPVLGAADFGTTPTPDLEAIAKECFTATKLRWPEALAAHVRLAVITQDSIQIKDL